MLKVSFFFIGYLIVFVLFRLLFRLLNSFKFFEIYRWYKNEKFVFRVKEVYGMYLVSL